jgi:formylglycine-generating enzyme required for sulfatase activity
MSEGLEKLEEILREKLPNAEVQKIITQLTIASGDGSVSIEGDAAEAVIVTGNRHVIGDNNHVVINNGTDAETIRKILLEILPTEVSKYSSSQRSILPSIDRRKFFKWTIFGGVGTISVFFLKEIFDRLPPHLFSIQIFPVKLNEQGAIIAKPKKIVQIYKEELGNGISLTMVKIPAGKFLMGSPNDKEVEEGRWESESPQREVKVSEFYIGQTLVTQAQWEKIMGNNRSVFPGGGKLPVENVSWIDTQEFCEKLSDKMKRAYRLPSEAEWEYACRAGTITPFHFGKTISSDVANYRAENFPYEGNKYSGKYGEGKLGIFRKSTTPVGGFPPNGFGLYDMHGNLWEWCLDHWHQNYEGIPLDGSPWISDNVTHRVLRGGSWDSAPRSCRSASRFSRNPDYHDKNSGFRVVCVL